MSAIKPALNPELINLLLKTKPVFRKRTPLWFFTNEFKTKGPVDSDGPESNDEPQRRLKRTEIWDLWNAMRPEAKRRYFNMAEIDEVRYKEQKALWFAEIGSLISKQGTDFQRVAKVLESFKSNNQDEIALPKYHKHYNSMIQSESTKTLYKELVEKVEKINLEINPDALISDVPKDCRPLLNRPRRPPSPFVLYANDNREKLTAARSEQNSRVTFLAFAAEEWAKLGPREREPYEKEYSDLLSQYNAAMEQFKKEISNASDINFDQASRERKAFRTKLRKKLREYDIVPVNVRNSFIFFLKENKGIPLVKLTKMWNKLPEEQKLKYKLLSEQDNDRYYRQKTDFVRIKRSIDTLLGD